VKGIWCVPKYSNPDGIVYSPDTIRRLAGLRPAAPDFVLMWDNAYCVHEFDGPYVPFPDILGLCREAGNPDMVFEFASTSKITLPGAGMSVMAASEANLQYMQKLMGVQMISYDKVNQLRQVLYLRDKEHTLEIMAEHGRILKPKFQMVLDTLERELALRHIENVHPCCEDVFAHRPVKPYDAMVFCFFGSMDEILSAAKAQCRGRVIAVKRDQTAHRFTVTRQPWAGGRLPPSGGAGHPLRAEADGVPLRPALPQFGGCPALFCPVPAAGRHCTHHGGASPHEIGGNG
jgi:hypothetical protein